jgi:uncharacterized repeat protein (TIGR03803 family)
MLKLGSRTKNYPIPRTAILAVLIALLLLTCLSAFGQETILYNFNDNGVDGYFPYTGVIADSAGNLYTTTFEGGTYNLGTAIELVKSGDSYTEKILHNFGNSDDGQWPKASLVFDSAGNLYGTTYTGGAHGLGTVFELSPTKSGDWKEKLLHSFNSGNDGSQPSAGLIFDSAGNLYGATYFGGIYNGGTVFELEPQADGKWQSVTLHSFGNGTGDGQYLANSLIFDSAGNLYGTTVYGGNGNGGTVFELSPANGSWSENILFNFNVIYGIAVVSNLIFDADGNLYGTASQGGAYGKGTAFELSPSSGGSWNINILNQFGKNAGDAMEPHQGMVFDSHGNLYGTTPLGGTYNVKAGGDGTIYELKPEGNGAWKEAVLYEFGSRDDGANPACQPLLLGGNLYGTTTNGGTNSFGGYSGFGTVFEFLLEQ